MPTLITTKCKECNITKHTQNIIAKNKKTGEIKKVNLLHVGQRRFNCPEDKKWGEWHDYSKRGDWEIFINRM